VGEATFRYAQLLIVCFQLARAAVQEKKLTKEERLAAKVAQRR
jgi:hypothetical protein